MVSPVPLSVRAHEDPVRVCPGLLQRERGCCGECLERPPEHGLTAQEESGSGSFPGRGRGAGSTGGWVLGTLRWLSSPDSTSCRSVSTIRNQRYHIHANLSFAVLVAQVLLLVSFHLESGTVSSALCLSPKRPPPPRLPLPCALTSSVGSPGLFAEPGRASLGNLWAWVSQPL